MSGLEQSKVLTQRDAQLIQAFVNGIGRAARRRGFAQLTEQPAMGITWVSMGFLDGWSGPAFIATLEILTDNGLRHAISVRRDDNVPVTSCARYPDVASALVAAQPYFQQVASTQSRAAQSTLKGHLTRILGL